MIGEGIIGDVPLQSSEMNGIVSLTLLVAIGISAGICARFLEFGPRSATSFLEQDAYYLVRWKSEEARIVSIGSEAFYCQSGENSRRVTSLEEAKSLIRLLRRQLPEASFSLYRVNSSSSSLSPISLTQVQGQVKDAQAIWDQELTSLAEEEANAARSKIDDEWSNFSREQLQLGRSLREQVDIVIIGGDEDNTNEQDDDESTNSSPRPISRKPACRLCNGKGYILRFNGAEQLPCNWCNGTGVCDEDINAV